MGRSETDIAVDEISLRRAAERELEVIRIELAEQIAARHEVQIRLEQELAQRDRIIAEGAATETRLRESETALRQLFDQNLDSMMILNLETGRYIDINDEYSRNSGYSREEVVGKRSRELSSFGIPRGKPPYRLVAELKRVGVVREHGGNPSAARTGSTYSGLISAMNLHFRGHLCCITITRDIGALKETQRELIAARESRARQLTRQKSDFLSSMSHEIRTPMNAVLGMADMLWESDLTEEQRRYLDIMRNNGATLLDLINDILDLAKVESGQLRFEEVDFDIRELVDKAAETMAMRAHEKHLELAGLVAADVPHNLVGDPLRLRQVIVNLLSNAVKFTDRGEIVLSVEMVHPDAGTGTVSLRFSVTDTRIGSRARKPIRSLAHSPRPIPRPRESNAGTGLGLTIVKRLVEMYHGQVTVESEVGKGSTFSFSAEFKTRPAPATAAIATTGVDLAGMRILVVDDTAANRMILIEALTSQGVVVTSAESGRDALDEIDRAAASGESYQAVLLDCRMPAMDGIEVADQIRHHGLEHDHPIIMMLTSDDLDATKARARAVGVEVYMIKPIRRANLFEALSRALGAAGATPTGASPSDHADADPIGENDVFEEMRPLRILLADDSRDNRLLVQACCKEDTLHSRRSRRWRRGGREVQDWRLRSGADGHRDADRGRLLRDQGDSHDREGNRTPPYSDHRAHGIRSGGRAEKGCRRRMRCARRQAGQESHPTCRDSQGDPRRRDLSRRSGLIGCCGHPARSSRFRSAAPSTALSKIVESKVASRPRFETERARR